MPKDELALLIPILAITLGVSAGMLAIWIDYRKKRELFQLHHAERMAAIEKGIDVPPLPPEFYEGYRRRRGPDDALRGGLKWLLVGIALSITFYVLNEDPFTWAWGLVPTAVGIANLLYYTLSRRTPGEGALAHSDATRSGSGPRAPGG